MANITLHAVLSTTLDYDMEPGIAVFDDSTGDPYTPVAEVDFYCDGSEDDPFYDAELAALGFYRLCDWDRDPSGYRFAAVAKAEGDR